MSLTIGVDIGGTKIAIGVIAQSGEILQRDHISSPANDRTKMLAAVIAGIDRLRAKNDVTAIGISAAGLINRERDQIMFSPNVDLTGSSIKSEVELATGLPVLLENDANSAAWGEYKHGAGVGFSNIVLLTIGTGLGCGFVIDDKLLIGGYGMAAEAGHMVIKPDGQLCGCGQRGCLEQYASGQALTRSARTFVSSGSPGADTLFKSCGGDVTLLTGQMVTAAALNGDPASIAILADAGKWLGYGIAAIAAMLDPEIFIVGGGGGDAGDLILDPARTAFEQRLTAKDHRPMAKIVSAKLGNDAGMVGVADLARL
jgi:glucokinase